MELLEGLLCAGKPQCGTTRMWMLTDVMRCMSQRLKEILGFKYTPKKRRKMKIQSDL